MTDNEQYRLPTITVEQEYASDIVISDDVTRNCGIGIEIDAEYLAIAEKRVAHAEAQMRLPLETT